MSKMFHRNPEGVEQTSNLRRVGGVIGLILLVLGAIVVARNVGTYGSMLPPNRDDPRWAAQQFAQKVVSGDYVGACLAVVDNGTILNPCLESLPERDDIDTVARLDPEVRVRTTREQGEAIDVTESDLSPRPGWKVNLRLLRAANDGMWKVRELNGRPIRWE